IPEEEKNLGALGPLDSCVPFYERSCSESSCKFRFKEGKSLLTEIRHAGLHACLFHYTVFVSFNQNDVHMAPLFVSLQQVQNFGDPFFLAIHEGETLEEVKIRIQKKLRVSDEEFSKWKFAFLSLGRPEYLQDSDIKRDVYGAWEQYLGLEHSDNTPKRSYAANQNRHAYEKPVRIYN
ncbi:hypothetical protein MIMGU_mgv1a0004251mg, partial [Erythranthe guttata]